MRAFPANLIIIFWFLVTGVALITRSPLPVDETRYLAVAWDMWINNNYLVPHLNGELYSHKPPLLFWLITLGWAIFGVSDWWPRLIGPLFGLGCIYLVFIFSKIVWPENIRIQRLAPLILFGCGFWTLFSTLIMFDTVLSFFTLLAHLGIVLAWRERGIIGFLILALAIGLGGLTKGPVILVHVLPVVLTVPLWGKRILGINVNSDGYTLRWHGLVLVTLALGISITLFWAILAGLKGGQEYRDAIFWGQTIGRMSKSFAHQRDWWWYVPLLPLLIFPWIIWPPVLRGLLTLKLKKSWDGGALLCIIWFSSAFIFFSFVSGKQLHYLLPEVPALVLLIAKALTNLDDVDTRHASLWLIGICIVLTGFFVIFSPLLLSLFSSITWLNEVNYGWGGLIILIGIFLQIKIDGDLEKNTQKLVISMMSLIIIVHLVLSSVLYERYDLSDFSKQLKIWQDKGYALANFGKYHGQYQFLGRLLSPISEIGVLAVQKEIFLKKYPKGRIIAYYKKVPSSAKPIISVPFRTKTIVVWEVDDFIKNPKLGDRLVNN